LIGESGAASRHRSRRMAYARAAVASPAVPSAIQRDRNYVPARHPAQFSWQEHRLYRPERRGLVQSRHDADGIRSARPGDPRRHEASRSRTLRETPVPHSQLPNPDTLEIAIATKSPAVSCHARWPRWRLAALRHHRARRADHSLRRSRRRSRCCAAAHLIREFGTAGST